MKLSRHVLDYIAAPQAQEILRRHGAGYLARGDLGWRVDAAIPGDIL